MIKIFFLGAGKMATAIAGGLVKSNLYRADELAAFDVNSAACSAFTSATAIATMPLERIREAEALLIAVKPQMIAQALEPVKKMLAGKLIISIAAGITIEKLESLTGSRRIVRVMPNTPALVGAGAAGFAPGAGAAQADADLVGKILSAVGSAFQVREQDLDAVTGLSGSGPAYVFEFIQALADGGVAEGLPRDIATRLAAQTLLGAAKMVLETGKHPNELCDAVTSPGGTTSRGLELLAERAFHAAAMQAVRAASKRSRELGK